MEYLVQHLEWLDEVVDNYADDYLLIDCPGQIELYSHIPVMRQIARHLTSLGYNVCAVYCVDALFMAEPAKFLGGALACLSAMVSLEVPHVNVMTKCDLIKNEDGEAADDEFLNTSVPEVLSAFRKGSHDERFDALTHAFGDLLEQYSLVAFVPLDIGDEDSVARVVTHVDRATQYGEDEEPNEEDYFRADASRHVAAGGNVADLY
ncbi:MAG: hypothetical protein MHM6MM_007480 [Cercozoa sp. M6MM]